MASRDAAIEMASRDAAIEMGLTEEEWTKATKALRLHTSCKRIIQYHQIIISNASELLKLEKQLLQIIESGDLCPEEVQKEGADVPSSLEELSAVILLKQGEIEKKIEEASGRLAQFSPELKETIAHLAIQIQGRILHQDDILSKFRRYLDH